jgi:hypothetical protein
MPSGAASSAVATPAASTTVAPSRGPAVVSTPATRPAVSRRTAVTGVSGCTRAPWSRAPATSRSVTPTGSAAPSPGAQTAQSGGCRRPGSSAAAVAASTTSWPGPASGVVSAAQDSEPDQVTGRPGNSASSRRYSSVAVIRRPADGPVRTPADPIQANEFAVTPAPGCPASTRVTAAPARAA